jgi:hypothetical protein
VVPAKFGYLRGVFGEGALFGELGWGEDSFGGEIVGSEATLIVNIGSTRRCRDYRR